MTRSEILESWLERVNAERLWCFENRQVEVTGYTIAGRLAIVIRGTNDSWNLLVPASKDTRAFTTLDAAAVILGVEGCRGLAEGTLNSADAGPAAIPAGWDKIEADDPARPGGRIEAESRARRGEGVV